MTIAEIIEMCGGEGTIVFRLGLADRYVVRRWRERGIPLKNWDKLMELAKANGKKLTSEMLWTAVSPLIKE